MSNTMRKLINFPVGIRTTATALTDNDIPNRAQIASMIAGKINVKDSTIATTDANIDLATGGLLTIDGVTVADGDRVLVRVQTDTTENGIYVASTGAWSRAEDADTGEELKPYTAVFVRQGTAHGGHKYVLQADDAIVVDTDAQTWVHESAASTDASDIAADQTDFDVITGANVQAALDSIDDELVTLSTVYTSTSTTLTSGAAVNFSHNLGSRWLSGIKVYESSTGEEITHTVTVTAVDTSNLTVQNDDADIDVIVVARV